MTGTQGLRGHPLAFCLGRSILCLSDPDTPRNGAHSSDAQEGFWSSSDLHLTSFLLSSRANHGPSLRVHSGPASPPILCIHPHHALLFLLVQQLSLSLAGGTPGKIPGSLAEGGCHNPTGLFPLDPARWPAALILQLRLWLSGVSSRPDVKIFACNISVVTGARGPCHFSGTLRRVLEPSFCSQIWAPVIVMLGF